MVPVAQGQRVFHLTFYKAGSQWVRDVLADPRICPLRLRDGGVDVPTAPWPEAAPGEIVSPLYCAGLEDWRRNRQPEDRAIVVIRDPRDLIVSLAASLRASHAPSLSTLLLRDVIREASPRNRVLLCMHLFSYWESRMRSWKEAKTEPNVLLARYRDLAADSLAAFRRMVDFLGWQVSDASLQRVVEENSFAARTGRRPGDENPFSHWRKGQPDDWKNWFDADLGRRFETAFPGLLTDLDYEQNGSWWHELPEPRGRQDQDGNGKLLQVLEEHQRELQTIRTAARERELQILALHAEREQLRNSVSWRYGFEPLRRLASLLKR